MADRHRATHGTATFYIQGSDRKLTRLRLRPMRGFRGQGKRGTNTLLFLGQTPSEAEPQTNGWYQLCSQFSVISLQHSAFSNQHSAISIQQSAISIQLSGFSIQLSARGLRNVLLLG